MLFLLNYLYKKTTAFKNIREDVNKSKDNIVRDNKYQIVNLGSNHPKYGFDYSETGVCGINLAANSQTFEYDFAVLRNFAKHLEKGAIVVIPICLLKFFLYRQTPRWLHYRYYTILPKEDIVNYSSFEKIRENYFPLFFHPFLIKRLIRDEKKDIRGDLQHNMLNTSDELKKDAESWINCWNNEFDIDIPSLDVSDDNLEDIKKNIKIVNQIISFCLENGFRPILTVLPVTHYLSSLFSVDFLNTHLYKYIKESNKQGVLFLNYLDDDQFTSPELYINSFFFNINGRKEFTKQFINDLRSHSIL